MCKLIVGIKNSNEQLEKIVKTILIQRNDLYKEPHGMGAFILDANNKVTTCRDFEDYDRVFSWFFKNLAKAKVFGLHTRTATDGTVNNDNVHYFKHRKAYFAHNGIVSECSSYGSYEKTTNSGWGKTTEMDYDDYTRGYGKEALEEDWDDLADTMNKKDREYWEEQERKAAEEIIESEFKKEKKKSSKSDSYKFLNKMTLPADVYTISDDMDMLEFNGVAHLVLPEENRMYLMATRRVHVHTDFETYSLNYSYIPESEIPSVTRLFGLDIEDDGMAERLKKYTIAAGIYEIDLDKDIPFVK